MHPGVFVRAVRDEEDCRSVVNLTGQNFPEECGTVDQSGGAGLNIRQWSELEFIDLCRQPWLWPGIGLAVEQGSEGDRVLGAVVLSFENDKDGTLSYWEVSKRFGLLATAHNYLYDQILEYPLKAEECLIDFIAVSPEARGKGVGALLMAWAQETGARILQEREPEAVAAHGPQMTLWVAADNSVALKLYRKAGYEVTQKTDDGVCHCIMSRLLKAFLGHPVWYKMTKQLPTPEALATVKPTPISILMAVAAGQVAAAAATAAAAAAPGAPPLAADSETAAVAVAEAPSAAAAELECELKIPAHNPNGQPAVALSPCPSSVKEAVQAQPVEGSVGRKLSVGSVGAAGASSVRRSHSDAGWEGGRRRSSNCGGGGREQSNCGDAGGQQQQQQQAAPLLALQLVRSLSSSVVAANTVAAASLVHMIRRTSENEGSSGQAAVAVLAA